MDNRYIWQLPNWPNFRWDLVAIAPAVKRIEMLQAEMYGRLASFSADLINWVSAETTAQEVVSTSAIEGVSIDLAGARSSLMKRLGLGVAHDTAWRLSEDAKGIINLVADAAENSGPLSHERLKAWHDTLFPKGRSGTKIILSGEYRASAEPMQVVSPARYGHKVHYEAPPADRLETDMSVFIDWFNGNSHELPAPVRGGIAHLWFETLHPFEDGNGRIGRAIWDLTTVQASPKRDARISRISCLSPYIAKVREQYCDELEAAQNGDLDITRWLSFSLRCMEESLLTCMQVAERVASISRFWTRIRDLPLDEKQRKVLDVVLTQPAGDDWITTRRFTKIAGGIVEMTAFRAIDDLLKKGVLEKDPAASGRGTRYRIVLKEPAAPKLTDSEHQRR